MPLLLENRFLSLLLKHKTAVMVFLKTGVGLRGIIRHFDDRTLLLEEKKQQQLVYTTNIASIVPLSADELNKPTTRRRRSMRGEKTH